MTIQIRNAGELDLRGIKTFGACAKETENPIGYFGTGLKYALAVLLREGCKVELYVGMKRYKFKVKKQAFRNETLHVVYMNGEELPFTTELGKNWELWMAYRELACNAMDEGTHGIGNLTGHYEPKSGCTTFLIDGIDGIYEDHDSIFLSSKPLYQLDGVNIHDDLGGGQYIYYRGIRVYKLAKPGLFTYNITDRLTLTEDRTVSSLTHIYIALAKAIVKAEQPSLIRQILTANNQFFESTIDYHWWNVKPGECFNTVVSGYIGGRTSFNKSARDVFERDHPRDEPPEILQFETLPMEQRRRLWAALTFWGKLGFDIPKSIVHVTTALGKEKAKVLGGHIYLSKFVLEMDMRYITGFVYKQYAKTKPTIGDTKQEDLLIDTIVDFGEQLLGVSKRKSA